MHATLLIEHLDQLYVVPGPAPRTGARQGDHAPVPDGAVACNGATIVAAGTTTDVRQSLTIDDETEIVDGRGQALVPGFVDAHTHVVFAGDRRGELRERLAGATYAEIAAAGGGILSTVRSTRSASAEELAAATRRRLSEMLACGTTTCEAKSGYGLDIESELRLLGVMRLLSADQPIEIVPTFMAAHEVPPEYHGRQAQYVQHVIEDMIPRVGDLAEFCDVFCDRGFFTPAESRAILEAGRSAGLQPRIHADELAGSGGAEVAAAVGARSADHLVHATPAGMAALAAAGVVATLLPCASLFLKLDRYAPAREMIHAGVAVALATDVNPGGGFSPSMPFAMTLGCFAMRLTFEEALTAATLNAAFSLNRHDRVGSLEPGKQFDAVLIDGPATHLLRVGTSPVAGVFKRGRRVS
jgi:imidazolonepropionase